MTEPIPVRQFRVLRPGAAAVVPHTVPPPGSGEVLVEALFSGVSRGTETLVFQGRVPGSQHEAMRAPFQYGSFPGPLAYGYSSVGRVAESEHAPPGLGGVVVFCLHPHQDRYVVPANAVHPLPDGVPPQRAVLGANMETALNVVWDAGLAPGDRAVVVGGGVVGLLTAWITARIPGTETLLVDIDPRRATVASALGVRFATDSDGIADADVVIHASGSPDGLAAALDVAGTEARVVEASWFGDRPVALHLGEAFHARRLTVRSSQVGRVPPERRPRWSTHRRLATALTLLGDPVLDRLVTSESTLEELPRVMRDISEGSLDTLCHCVRYEDRGAQPHHGSERA